MSVTNVGIIKGITPMFVNANGKDVLYLTLADQFTCNHMQNWYASEVQLRLLEMCLEKVKNTSERKGRTYSYPSKYEPGCPENAKLLIETVLGRVRATTTKEISQVRL